MQEEIRDQAISYDNFFEKLFVRYSVGLLMYARHFVSNEQSAEDIVHDVFVSLWERRCKISTATATAYLFKATRNSCLNHLAHLKTRTTYQNDILERQDLLEGFDTDMYVYSELQANIEAAIEKLPPQRKAIFIMNRFEGKTFEQIAEQLNISPRTVDKHIELALRNMRKELAEYLAF